MGDENIIPVGLTKEQINQIGELFDIATKAGGLQNATVALPILQVIGLAVQAHEAAKAEPETEA